MASVENLKKRKREIEASIGMLQVLGRDTTSLSLELAGVRQQIKTLEQS